MENLKKEKKMSTKELEKFVNKQTKEESNFGRDYIILWSLLVIAIAGVILVLTTSNIHENSKNEQISKKRVNVEAPIARAAVPISNKSKKQIPNNVVTIEGEKEAFEVIEFHVEGWTKNATYKWDFGDSITRTMHKPFTSHAYQTPGTYTVVLTATYEGETITLLTEKLEIIDSIEVPDGALTEMEN